MAKTNAERQAEYRAKQKGTITDQEATMAILAAENVKLREENSALKDKVHAMEIAALKAKAKQARATKPTAK